MEYKKIQHHMITFTEKVLTKIYRRRLRKKAKENQRSWFTDLLFTVLFVVVAVVLINMFIFQNYKIPSRSMVDTLEVGDLIFVEKVDFGPEILPGTVKLPAFRDVKRGEVISFESDDYARSGPLVELFDRFVYIVTLSFVNLKVEPDTHEAIIDLLVKRVIGLPGEWIRCRNSQWEIQREYETVWITEEALNMQRRKPYRIISDFESDHRSFIEQDPFDRGDPFYQQYYRDYVGHYIPEDRFFPMGDNRPDSRDARVYGPVPLKRIQGKALFRFFPLDRAGAIE